MAPLDIDMLLAGILKRKPIFLESIPRWEVLSCWLSKGVSLSVSTARFLMRVAQRETQ